MPDAHTPDRGPSVAEALRALPLEAPERSAWPLLSERIAAAHPAARPRWPFLLAAAAALALAAVMPGLLSRPAAPPTAAPVASATVPSVPVTDLMAESAQLEYLIGAVADEGGAASASATALGLEYEDRLQQLDTALSDPTLADDDRRRLWQTRVALLRDYAGLLGTRQVLAAQGDRLEGALVATY